MVGDGLESAQTQSLCSSFADPWIGCIRCQLPDLIAPGKYALRAAGCRHLPRERAQ